MATGTMTAPGTMPPARRPELLVRPLGDGGDHVVKDPRTGEYFNLGPQESFLLLRLDGRHTATQICGAFEAHFGEPLTGEDLEEFVSLARAQGFLRPPGASAAATAPRASAHAASPSDVPPPSRTAPSTRAATQTRTPLTPAKDVAPFEAAPAEAPSEEPAPRPRARQSILFWRKSVYDPDRLFNWLEPKVRFVWTRGFVAVSAGAIVLAAGVLWANRGEMVSRFPDVWRWETLVLGWLTLVIATTLHEFAHGLTCKHYGGEVHELGFLLMFFLPCFYCNVSDAWLFRERSKRLWVTLAGGYLDLCLWAAAAFVWRLTIQDSLVNYLAWVVVSVCGVRTFFNFNPLIKLDGYYLLSDLAGIPNLRQRGWDRFMAYVRWAMWGGPRPAAEPRGNFLLAFGAAAWVYSLLFLGLMVAGFVTFGQNRIGFVGTAMISLLGLVSFRALFQGFSGGEVKSMFMQRHKRVAIWGGSAVAVALAVLLVPMQERATGSFEVRPAARAEVRAPLSGFLREVRVREGEEVRAAAPLARLEVTDLASQIARKRAETLEGRAKLARMEAGPRAPGDLGAEVQLHAAEVAEAEAQVQRLREETRYLESLWKKQWVYSPIPGVVATPRLPEKVGQFCREGDLICTVDDCTSVEVEIALSEQDVAKVRPGQQVDIKVRALPYQTLRGKVDRVAPAAAKGDAQAVQASVTAYVRIDSPPPGVRPGMTGTARVACGRSTVAQVLGGRALRYLRTEFWW